MTINDYLAVVGDNSIALFLTFIEGRKWLDNTRDFRWLNVGHFFFSFVIETSKQSLNLLREVQFDIARIASSPLAQTADLSCFLE